MYICIALLYRFPQRYIHCLHSTYGMFVHVLCKICRTEVLKLFKVCFLKFTLIRGGRGLTQIFVFNKKFFDSIQIWLSSKMSLESICHPVIKTYFQNADTKVKHPSTNGFFFYKIN